MPSHSILIPRWIPFAFIGTFFQKYFSHFHLESFSNWMVGWLAGRLVGWLVDLVVLGKRRLGWGYSETYSAGGGIIRNPPSSQQPECNILKWRQKLREKIMYTHIWWCAVVEPVFLVPFYTSELAAAELSSESSNPWHGYFQ